MKRFIAVTVALLGMIWIGTAPLHANDQEFVIGVGLGVHNFSDSDDFRKGTGAFAGDDEIKAGGLFQFYGEWYLLDDIGFGRRSMSITGGRTYSYLDAELDQTVTIQTFLVTAHWVPIGSESYTRLGLMAGLGPATYEAKEKLTDDSGALGGSYDESESSSGSAFLVGAYVDWGGEDFGARFGLNSLSTDLEPIDTPNGELEVDGSGVNWYFDLRWAFE